MNADQSHVHSDRVSVLLADDDPDYRRLMTHRLRKWGYDVEAVENGEQACRSLMASDRPRCVLLDHNMPEMTGIEVCETVRTSGTDLSHYILILTGSDSNDDLLTALRAGVDDYVTKGKESELEGRLERALGRMAPQLKSKDSLAVPFWETFDKPDHVNGYVLAEPQFDAKSFSLRSPIPTPLLENWQSNGRAEEVLLDRVMVCPRCESLPTFRMGCQSCGSGRMGRETWLHHFACAHMGPVQSFRNGNSIRCPKCLTDKLISGADFDRQPGLYVCLDCEQRHHALQLIGHCLSCSHRFSANDAEIKDVTGYYILKEQASAKAPHIGITQKANSGTKKQC